MNKQKKSNAIFLVSNEQDSILNGLSTYKYLSTPMVQKLCNIESVRTTQYRLKVLWENKLINRQRINYHIGEGSNPFIFSLTQKGYQYFEQDNMKKDDKIIRGAIQIDHLLNVNWVLQSIHKSIMGTNLQIDFIPYYKQKEMEAYHLNFIPDAIIILSKDEKQSLLFLEMDNDTEPISSSNKHRSSIEKMFNSYLNLLRKDKIKLFGNFKGFRVLIVANSKKRMSSLANSGIEQQHSKCLWFSSLEDIEDNILYNRIWLVDQELKSLVSTFKKG